MAAPGRKAVANAVAGGAIGFGAIGLLTPKLLVRTYGLPDTAPFRFMARLWATRTAALGAIMLTAPEAEQRNLYVISAAVNTVDAAVAAAAGTDLSRRSRFLAALTSAAFAVASVALAADLLP